MRFSFFSYSVYCVDLHRKVERCIQKGFVSSSSIEENFGISRRVLEQTPFWVLLGFHDMIKVEKHVFKTACALSCFIRGIPYNKI